MKPAWVKWRKGCQGAEKIPLWKQNGYLGSNVEGTEREKERNERKKKIIGRDQKKERDKRQKQKVQGKAGYKYIYNKGARKIHWAASYV